MTFLKLHRGRLLALAGLIAPLVACAVLVPFRTHFLNSDAALVLVAVVVAVAASGRRTAGLLAAVSAAAWFDFFLTRPYERFTITRTPDIETTVLLVLVGAAVTELAALARRRSRAAATDEALLAAVQSTARLVAAGGDAQTVVGQVKIQLSSLLGIPGCTFTPGGTTAALRGPRLDEDGNVLWGGARWDVAEHGLPIEPLTVPAYYGGRLYGRFILTPTAPIAPSVAARQVAVALADLAACAVDRDTTSHAGP